MPDSIFIALVKFEFGWKALLRECFVVFVKFTALATVERSITEGIKCGEMIPH